MINLFETHNDFCNNHGVFHRCKLNGKDYFFTEERIKLQDMPDGLYKRTFVVLGAKMSGQPLSHLPE